MNKLDKETKILIYISLFMTGIVVFALFETWLIMVTYGILHYFLGVNITDLIWGIIIVLSTIISGTSSFLMNRCRYRLFKERSGFE